MSVRLGTDSGSRRCSTSSTGRSWGSEVDKLDKMLLIEVSPRSALGGVLVLR